MAKANVKNERAKRGFFKWLRGAEGCSLATVDRVEQAILRYEDFTKHEDFALFNSDKAEVFKKWLGKREVKGKPLSVVTYHTYLRYLRKFFTWLAWQPGYRSRIRPDMVAFLRASEKEARMATQTTPRNYPQLDYVLKLTRSIPTATEVDQRDRALLAFTLLSGMRDKAIITLPVGCFDEATLTVNQNPRKGVQTKFAKLIPTTLFVFDQSLLGSLLDWAAHLKAKGFGFQDPLFPRAKITQGRDGMSFESPIDVEAVYWKGTGGIRAVFKRRTEQAGLPYFPPHTFRHLAVDLALKACKTGEQIKAVSQNFGHEHIATSLSSYGNFDPLRLSEVVRGLDFSTKAPQLGSDKHLVEQMKKLLLANNDRML
jgi:integrase